MTAIVIDGEAAMTQREYASVAEYKRRQHDAEVGALLDEWRERYDPNEEMFLVDLIAVAVAAEATRDA